MKRFPILLIAIVAFVAVWTAGWFFLAGQVHERIAAYAETDGVAVPRLTCSDLAVGGFPFKFSPHCTDPVIVSGDYTLSLSGLRGTALFYRPNHIQMFADGPARIVDAFTGSEQEITWTGLRASLRLDDAEIERLSIVGDDLVIADALFGEVVYASLGHAEFHLVDVSNDGGEAGDLGNVLDMYAAVQEAESAAFEIANGSAGVDARLAGLPPMALWGHPDVLRIWAGNGGAVTLREASATADGLMIEASGQASLTEAGTLDARLELASQGIVERIEGIEDDPRAALLTGTPDEEGVYRQKISVRGGAVFVGLIPVMSLAPVF